MLLGFEKTNGERQVLPPEEEHLFNGYVGSIILFGGSGHFLAELKYYHPNRLVTEDGAIWTSPKYNDLESMLKKNEACCSARNRREVMEVLFFFFLPKSFWKNRDLLDASDIIFP